MSAKRNLYDEVDLTSVARTDAGGDTLLSTHSPGAVELALSGRIPT